MTDQHAQAEAACRYITRLIRFYGIQPEDWPVMQRESPEIWARIDEIEWSGPYDDVEKTSCLYRALVMNHERMFLQLASRRGQRHAA